MLNANSSADTYLSKDQNMQRQSIPDIRHIMIADEFLGHQSVVLST